MSLAPHDGSVDGPHERRHGVVLGHEQKVDRAVRPCDVTVEADAEPEDDERIEVVRVPLEELDSTIDICADAKSIVGLMMLRDHLASRA